MGTIQTTMKVSVDEAVLVIRALKRERLALAAEMDNLGLDSGKEATMELGRQFLDVERLLRSFGVDVKPVARGTARALLDQLGPEYVDDWQTGAGPGPEYISKD